MLSHRKTKNKVFLSHDSRFLSFNIQILSRTFSNGAGFRAPSSPFLFRELPRLKQGPDTLWIYGQSADGRPGLSGCGPAYGRPVDGTPPTARPQPGPHHGPLPTSSTGSAKQQVKLI